MIIGVSGKMKSGKDLVANIIRYLTSPDVGSKGTFEECEKNGFVYIVTWELHRFADELKETLCRWIGCTMQQLESRDFKNKELGEEWWYYEVGGIILPRGFYTKPEDAKMCEERYLVKPTPRLYMQKLGTEAGRMVIHPNVWVNCLMGKYLCECDMMKKKHGFDHIHCMNCTGLPQWIIPDTRFPNEVKAIEDRGGIVIRVERPETDPLAGDHESETALDKHAFEYVIQNDGNINDLVSSVEGILMDLKII